MTITIILNPYANRWGAKERLPEVEEAARQIGLACEIVVTSEPNEGIALAHQAAQDPTCRAVVAAGGDGTINEVINGLLAAAGDAPTKPFGILPLGTANDFYKMAGLPDGLEAALRVIAAGHTRQIDGGQVNGRYFVNNSAAGMEPMVTIENIKLTSLSGEIRYVVALVRALVRLKPWRMALRWDGGQYDGDVYLLSVCNSPRTGGFMMAPGALLDDGLLDVVIAPKVPPQTVLAILARLMRGTHINHPDVSFVRTTHVSVRSHPGTPVHADGEVFTESAEDILFRVLPGQVTLLSPPAAPDTA